MNRMHAFRVLIIEDDRTLTGCMRKVLEKEGFLVFVSESGKFLTDAVLNAAPDCVLIDLSVRDCEGIRVVSELRSWTGIPLLVISERPTEMMRKRLEAYPLTDCLEKPLDPAVLPETIRGLYRKTFREIPEEFCHGDQYRLRDLTVEFPAHRVLIGEEEKKLTPTEFRLLVQLILAQGELVTYDRIMREIWGPYAQTDTKLLRVHAANLRKKIEKDPQHPEWIETVPAGGFRLMR